MVDIYIANICFFLSSNFKLIKNDSETESPEIQLTEFNSTKKQVVLINKVQIK